MATASSFTKVSVILSMSVQEAAVLQRALNWITNDVNAKKIIPQQHTIAILKALEAANGTSTTR